MTIFFEPNPEFLKWIRDYAAGRLIIDCGCGENHLKAPLQSYGAIVLGVDMMSDSADIIMDVRQMTLAHNEDVLLLFCRPCHGTWVSDLISATKAEVLYIGLPKNLDLDLRGLDYEKIQHNGRSRDGERVWVLNRKERKTVKKRTYMGIQSKDPLQLVYFGRVSGEKFLQGDGPSWFPWKADGFHILKTYENMDVDEAEIKFRQDFPEETTPIESIEWRYHEVGDRAERVYFVDGLLSPEGEWYKVHTGEHRYLAQCLYMQVYGEIPTFPIGALAKKGWLSIHNAGIMKHNGTVTKRQAMALRKMAHSCPDPTIKRTLLTIARTKRITD